MNWWPDIFFGPVNLWSAPKMQKTDPIEYYGYVEPAGDTSEPQFVILSKQAILDTYGNYWLDKMGYDFSSVKEHSQAIIDDFCIIHYAEKITPKNLIEFVYGR